MLHTLKPKERIRLRYLELNCLFISFMLKSVKIVKILFHQSINQLTFQTKKGDVRLNGTNPGFEIIKYFGVYKWEGRT